MAHLNVHQLEVFRAVARLGNITRAADELVISQPAVSEQIKELEIACGLPLLDRLPRGVRLTQAGDVVYEYAERMFTAAEQLEQTLAELRNLLRGRLRLGASMTIGQYVLPEVMGAFAQQYPGVQLSLAVGNSSEIVARVVERELGLGFVGGAPTHMGLIVVPYLVDEIVVIVAPGHDLAHRSIVSAEDLRGASWIARERGSATRSEAEACLASAGIELMPAMEMGSNEAVKKAVAAGLGFGLLSRLDVAAEAATEGLTVRTTVDLELRRLFCVCYRRDRRLTQAERAFLQFIDCQPEAGAPFTTTLSPVHEERETRVIGGGWEASMQRFRRSPEPTGSADHPGGIT